MFSSQSVSRQKHIFWNGCDHCSLHYRAALICRWNTPILASFVEATVLWFWVLCARTFMANVPIIHSITTGISLHLPFLASTDVLGEYPKFGLPSKELQWRDIYWASAKSLSETIENKWNIHAVFSSRFCNSLILIQMTTKLHMLLFGSP